MTEIDIKSIALFFFYATLDEQKAIEASAKAVEACKAIVSRDSQLNSQVSIVAATKSVWEKNRGRFIRGRPNFSADSGWVFPAKIDLGSWKEFQKSAQEDEFLCLIWSVILKFSDENISLGLGISTGTLRYRVGRALRKLGALSTPPQVKPNIGIVKS